jgi:hypothetical protein
MSEGARLIAAARARFKALSFDEKLAKVIRFAAGSLRVGEFDDMQDALLDAVKYAAWYGSAKEKADLEMAAWAAWEAA